tara:strand:- start:185 stop:931 length:747 start_codon:yes stop_codon:yes gene_type:complete
MASYGFVDERGNAYNTGGATLEEAIQNAMSSYPQLSAGGTFRIDNNSTNEKLTYSFNPLAYQEAIGSGLNYSDAFAQSNLPPAAPTPAAPIMAPPQQVEQKQEAAKPFVDFMDPQKTAAENMQSATTYVEPASTPAESVIQQTEDVFQQPVTTYTPAGTTSPSAVSNYTPAMAQGPRAVINPYMAAAPNIQPMAARPNVQMPPLPQVPAPQPSGTGIMGQLPQSSGPVLRAPSNAFSQDYAGFLTKRN